MNSNRVSLILIVSLLLQSCAFLSSVDGESKPDQIPVVVEPLVQPTLPSGQSWSELIVLPHKRKTVYQSAKLDGQAAVRATADRSATGRQIDLSIDPNIRPILSFAWKAVTLPEDADVSDRSLEDSATRVIVAFDGDRSTLDSRDRLMSDQARLLTGRELPYATLMYVWSNNHEIGTVIPNPHTKRIRKIVLSNKSTSLNQWHQFRRNVVADYEKAYGKKPKGKIRAIGIMTDSDNTGEKAVAYYGPISLTAGSIVK